MSKPTNYSGYPCNPADLPDFDKTRKQQCQHFDKESTWTAAWHDEPCPWCEIERLRAALEDAQKWLTELGRTPYYCQNCDCARCGNTRRAPDETSG